MADDSAVEGFFDPPEESHGLFRSLEVADEPEAGRESGVSFRLQDFPAIKSELVGHASADAVGHGVHVGVRGVDGDVVADGRYEAAFDVCRRGEVFQSAEDEGMVRHDEVVSFPDGFFHDVFGDVQTQERGGQFPVGVAADESGVVESGLQAQGGVVLD